MQTVIFVVHRFQEQFLIKCLRNMEVSSSQFGLKAIFKHTYLGRKWKKTSLSIIKLYEIGICETYKQEQSFYHDCWYHQSTWCKSTIAERLESWANISQRQIFSRSETQDVCCRYLQLGHYMPEQRRHRPNAMLTASGFYRFLIWHTQMDNVSDPVMTRCQKDRPLAVRLWYMACLHDPYC